MRDVDLLVVGAGPGGIAAATVAAECGLRVLVVDEGSVVGGQYLRPRPPRPKHTPLLRRFARSGASVALGETVWHVNAVRRQAFTTTLQVTFESLVVATGAFDRPLAVPGAGLPGVITAGAAQALAKDGSRLGSRVLLVGSGPFLLPVAQELTRTRTGIVELAFDRLPWMGSAPLHSPTVIPQAMRYGLSLARRQVPVRAGWFLQEVVGTGAVAGAVLAGSPGSRREGRTREVECDVVAIGYGFLPQLAVADLAGCRLRFDAGHRTWFVEVDARTLGTSVPGVFAVGELVGIGGHRKAIAEGLLAGYQVAGRPVPPKVRRSASRHRRFAEAARRGLEPPFLVDHAADGALVCRCEGVTAGQIRTAVCDGGTTIQGIRMRTRCGMGVCQGRMCGQLCAEIAADTTKDGIESVGRLATRTPARPVGMGLLLG